MGRSVLPGRLAHAIPLAEHALAPSGDRKERGTQAWALRLLGELAAWREPPDWESAEAHCHRGLGLLYIEIGRRQEARVALSAARALYHSMEMTFWRPQTEAALAELEGR